MQTKGSVRRGRPRLFDLERGVEVAQAIFHRDGYDAVSVSDLTGAMGIGTPSFYAAFRNKVGLFERVLERYAAERPLPLSTILIRGVDPGAALSSLLLEAARIYSSDSSRLGCLALEATASADDEARAAAKRIGARTTREIWKFVAQGRPERARAATDFMSMMLSGLSASARGGLARRRLERVARLAGDGLRASLS